MSAPVAVRTVDAHGFVHRFLPGEPGHAASGLTILALHGTGGDEHALVGLAQRVAPGAAVLSPRGPVLEQGMPRFFRRHAEGVFDLADLERRTGELGAFLDAAAAAYGVDRARVVALGYSNGANIAASLLLRQPSALAGGALLRAMVPFEPPPGGVAHAPDAPRAIRPRVLVASGRADPIVPRDQPERLAALLRAAGCAVELAWLDAGHQLVMADVERAAALARQIATGAPGRA